MAIIKIPRPPADAIDQDRPVSSLLKMQLEHLQHAEFRLPANKQTNIYINAIKTEGEAADYIRKVTERLHEAHGSLLHARKAPRIAGRRGLDLVASAAGPSASAKSKAKRAKKKTSPQKKANRKKRS